MVKMSIRRGAAVFVCLILTVACAGARERSFAQAQGQEPAAVLPVASGDLIERAREFDGRIVEFAGEAIGNVMRRGDYAWVNVFDGQNAVGIWMPAVDAGMIRHEGSYKMAGDRIAVRGVFNRACKEHGGDLDIHAASVRVIEPGRIILHSLPGWKMRLAGILAVLVGVLWILTRLKRK